VNSRENYFKLGKENKKMMKKKLRVLLMVLLFFGMIGVANASGIL
jgi:hypothetical protein